MDYSKYSRTIVTLYTSLVRPYLEYACPVWSPHLAKDINALEKVQRFACRVALGTWGLSSDQLLIRTGLPTLAAMEAVNNAAFSELFMAILLFLMVM